MNIRRNGLSKVTTSLFLCSLMFSSLIPAKSVSANFEPDYSQCTTDPKTGDTTASGDITQSNGGGVAGDWTTKGTQGYKAAKDTFDFFVNKGWSGAASSAPVGNAFQESRFNEQAINTTGDGGWGIFQFTPPETHIPHWDYKNKHSVKDQCEALWEDYRGAATSNGLKNADYMPKLAQMTDVKDATYKFWYYIEQAGSRELYESRAVRGDVREAAALKAYELFGGANISANSALFGANTATNNGQAEQQKNDPCSNLNSSNSDSGIVGVAKSLLGYFHYAQIHGESQIGSVDSPDKDGRTDCSGFVWLALTKAGYKTPKNMGWFTRPMEDDAKGKHQWLEEISENEAGPGDVVIVNTGSGEGSAGHTAILEENWKGDKTKVIQMGGVSNSSGVNESTFKESFLSLLNDGKPVFARPIKK